MAWTTYMQGKSGVRPLVQRFVRQHAAAFVPCAFWSVPLAALLWTNLRCELSLDEQMEAEKGAVIPQCMTSRLLQLRIC